MPCVQDVVKTLIGEEHIKKVQQVPVSNDTVGRRIREMASDVELQVIESIQQSPKFAIAVDESCDVAGCPQLVTFVRYLAGNLIVEEFLCCIELGTTTTGKDIFDALNEFFLSKGLSWCKCIAVCTDGARAMTGIVKGFIALVRQVNSSIMFTHCMIHREALASKELSAELTVVMNHVVRTINSIKSKPKAIRLFKVLCKDMGAAHEHLLLHTEVRWLSRGNALSRVFELREELVAFLADNEPLVEPFLESSFVVQLAYLADMFEQLNLLNEGLQGKHTTLIMAADKIRAFRSKLQSWMCRVNMKDYSPFKRLCSIKAQNAPSSSDRSIIMTHLSTIGTHLASYFPDIENVEWIVSPFYVNANSLSSETVEVENEFLELRANTALKEKYGCQSVVAFWMEAAPLFPHLFDKAVDMLLPFATTYACEQAFSTLAYLKNKHRNRLNPAADMRLALSVTEPRIDLLVQGK